MAQHKPPLETLPFLIRWFAVALLKSNIDCNNKSSLFSSCVMDAPRKWQPCTAQDIKKLWEKSMAGGFPPSHSFRLYMHLPYCPAQCSYCDCMTNNWGRRNRETLRDYVEDSIREARFFAPTFKDKIIAVWTVGGGSPTFLNAEDLHHWLGTVAQLFQFARGGIRQIELDPTITTRKKLVVLKHFGFNYLSIGVQTFNADILRAVNRGHQSYATVSKFFQQAREVGFDHFNADLMLGLGGETVSSFIESFQLLAKFKPASIAVYGLGPTEERMHSADSDRQEINNSYRLLHAEATDRLSRLAAKIGYKPLCGFPYDKFWLFVAEGPSEDFVGEVFEKGAYPPRKEDLAIGWPFKSSIFCRATYKRASGPFSSDQPLYQCADASVKEEMVNYILEQLVYLRRLDYAKFKDLFGRDIRHAFAVELAFLLAAGKVVEDKEGLVFLPTNISEANFAALFFLIDFIEKSHFSPGPLENIPGFAALRRRLGRGKK